METEVKIEGINFSVDLERELPESELEGIRETIRRFKANPDHLAVLCRWGEYHLMSERYAKIRQRDEHRKQIAEHRKQIAEHRKQMRSC
jgi:hypothetical protein